MPTRDDYERLIRHSLKEGEKVRIPMKDLHEYNAQRMILFRLMGSLKAIGVDVSLITTRKTVIENAVFLEIEHHTSTDPTFTFITESGEETRTVPRALPTTEDDKFESWLKDVRNFANQEDDNVEP